MKTQRHLKSVKTPVQSEDTLKSALLTELRAHFIRLQTERLYRGEHPILELVDQMSYNELKSHFKKALSA